MTGMKLEILSQKTGYFGLTISGQINTAVADFCKLIGSEFVNQQVGMAVDCERKVVSVLMEGFSIDFEKKSDDLEEIAKLLKHPLRAEEYSDGESMGTIFIAQ